MWRISGVAMPYGWGSPTAIPEFLGEPATGEPVAELWLGAHPKAPATVLGFGGHDIPLDSAIQQQPALLGRAALDRFGPRFPFLVKLLAAGGPLSLQVHPDQETAAAGHAREEAAGVPIDAAERTYKDPFHKPEVMIALAPTQTLAGFRAVEDARRLLSAVAMPWADRIVDLLDAADLRPALRALLDEDAWGVHRAGVLDRCEALAGDDRAYRLVGHLDGYFHGDSGAAAPLLLNVVDYGPGEALFVPTGQIHAHVEGFGIEVMAASDNVIRAGLTPKHVDKEALFGSLTAQPEKPHLRSLGDGRLDVGVSEFGVALCGPGESLGSYGPRILLSLEDGTVVDGLPLRRGEALLLADGDGPELVRGLACLVHVPGHGAPASTPGGIW